MINSSIASLLNLSPNWICACLPQKKSATKHSFQIVFLNEKIKTELNIDEEVFLNQPFENLFPAILFDGIEEKMEKVFAKGKMDVVEKKKMDVLELGDFVLSFQIKKWEDYLLIEIENISAVVEYENIQAEKQLMLEEANKLMNIALWTLDMKTGKISSNRNIAKFLEISNEEEELSMKKYYEMIVDEDVEEIKKAFAKKVKEGKVFTTERKMKTATGKIKFIETTCKPIFDFDECVKVVGTFRDVTIQKQEEENKIESERILKESATLTEISHAYLRMGTYHVNPYEKKIYFSKNVGKVLELPENLNELSFEDYGKLIHSAEKTDAAKRLQEMFSRKTPYTLERRMITAKGNEIVTEITGCPIYENNNLVKFIGTLRDISKKKSQEQRLLESEQLLKENAAMIKVAHDVLEMGTYTLDLNENQIFISEKITEILDLPISTKVISTDVYANMILFENDQDSLVDIIKNVVEKKTTYQVERKIKTAKGNIKYVENSGQPIFENNGKIKLAGTLRDISKRKEEENFLRETEQKVQEYAKSLEGAHKLLQMASFTIDMKTSIIKSELNLSEFFELDEQKKDFSVAEFMQFLSKEDQQELMENEKKIRDGNHQTFSKEKKIITSKGNIKYLEMADHPVFENGECVRVVGTFRNITERKKEENILKETQKKLHENALLLQQTHERLKMGTYVVDIKTGIIETTFNLSKFYELDNQKDFFTLDEFNNYVDENERQASKLNIRHAIAKGFSYTKERKIITAPGSVKYLEITGQPMFENEICTKLFGTLRDITERKTAEVKLHEANLKVKENVQRLISAHQLLRTGTWSLDIDNNHLSLSDEVLTLTNHRIPKELSLLDFFNFVPIENQASYMETLMLSLNTFTPVTEIMKLQFDDSSYIFIDVIGQFSEDKKILSGTFRDITEAHEKDLTLAKSEERLRELFENTPSMYFIINEQGYIDDVNQFGCDHLGFSKTDLIMQHHSVLFHKADVKSVAENLNLLKKSANNFLQWEARKRKKSGEIIWVKETARISENKQGEKIYLIVCEDITSDVANRVLVSKKQQELIRAKDKAEEAAKAKQQFASIMSHEIRTPLNAVIGMTNLLLMENPREDQINELSTLKFSAENLLLLVNDILDFSKIEAGKVVLEKIMFDPRKMIFNLKNSYRFSADEKGIFINSVIDDAIASQLKGDPTRLAQILNNLLSNAIKFTERGIVEISLRLITHGNEAESKIRFEISDTGIGIAKEKLQTIFDSFSQANSDTTRKYGGSGLGLTITKKLIELYGSNIFVESEIGKGTTFYFDLVFEKTNESWKGAADSIFDNIENFDRKKILLVEDNPLNQIIASRFLEKWNLEVDMAENGKEALLRLDDKNYDLILMDIHMPEMNGIETTKFIRNHKNILLHSIPIIAITAAAMENDKYNLLKNGMNDYISKPFNPEELQRKLSYYLQHRN